MKTMPPLLADDHIRGPEDAPLTVVQYGDYDCPHTRASASVLRELEASLAVPMRFVFRHFPLRQIHANAEILSEVAEAAGKLGRFWDVHDRLMGHQRGIIARDVMTDLESTGLDVEALEAMLGTEMLRDRVERDVKTGRAAGVHTTPTWYFNEKLWDGHYDLATLRERARAVLA